MRFRTIVALVASALLVAFVVVNWRVFAAPASVNLLFGTIEAPSGVLMLALFALGLVVLASYVGIWQTTLLMEFRRQAKELQAQRTLATSAEASRFTELGILIREEMAKSNQRVDAALEGLRGELRAAENSIAATLGEMDDRYRRAADPRVG